MVGLRVIFLNGEQLGAKLRRKAQKNSDGVRAAFRQTAEQAIVEIEERGRANITSAGNFGRRWTEGFQAKASEGGGRILITVRMGVSYWKVFQFGATIHGKPLLWIPLSFASDAKGVMARDYPGQLFRVNRKQGAPLLMTPPGIPKYFGKEQVVIPKKFRLIEIVREVARGLKDKYRKNRKR